MTESLHTATLHGDFRAPGTDSKRHRAQVEKWKHTSSHDPDIPITTKPRPVKRAPLYRVPVPSRPEALHLVRLECADQTRLDSIGALDVGGGVTDGDEGVLYNFDVDVSPASSLGLDSLVGQAEAHFVARETEKIVRAEYEVLDGEGETLRRRGKRSPRVEARGVEDVDGDWEAI